MGSGVTKIHPAGRAGAGSFVDKGRMAPMMAEGQSVGNAEVGRIVSCDWLESCGDHCDVVVVDIRAASDYAAGHIENSIGIPLEVPQSAWITMRDELLFELPAESDLFGVLGKFGIKKDSQVVVVTSVAVPPYPLANATRVAETLIYAGVKNVSVLDGGYSKWVEEGRAVTTVVPEVVPSTYDGAIAGGAFVGIDYVRSRIGRALIIDARDAQVYAGDVVEPWAGKSGHIPSAVSLPAVSIWNEDGTYRSRAELLKLVDGVRGEADRDREIILYCGVGGYASAWLYVLTEVLGHDNVKIFDGSAQEWVRHYEMEL